jgi:hypothetical protein
VALCWYSQTAKQQPPFVSNLVSKLRELTTSDEWGYVNTLSNPADLATREIDAEVLLESSLLWVGLTVVETFEEQPIKVNVIQTE